MLTRPCPLRCSRWPAVEQVRFGEEEGEGGEQQPRECEAAVRVKLRRKGNAETPWLLSTRTRSAPLAKQLPTPQQEKQTETETETEDWARAGAMQWQWHAVGRSGRGPGGAGGGQGPGGTAQWRSARRGLAPALAHALRLRVLRAQCSRHTA